MGSADLARQAYLFFIASCSSSPLPPFLDHRPRKIGTTGYTSIVSPLFDKTRALFASWSLFSTSLYLVMHWSDSNDKERTLVLQTVFAINMFSSSRAAHSVCPRDACHPTRTRPHERSNHRIAQHQLAFPIPDSSLRLQELAFASGSLISKSFYRLMRWSDCHDQRENNGFCTPTSP
jgi:hypothetical protein